jgi:hypothetical protein
MLASLVEINAIIGVVQLCIVCLVVAGTESDSTSMCFQPPALHKMKGSWQKYLPADGIHLNWVVFVRVCVMGLQVARCSLRTTKYLWEHVINLVYPSSLFTFSLCKTQVIWSPSTGPAENTPKQQHFGYTSMREGAHLVVMEHKQDCGTKTVKGHWKISNQDYNSSDTTSSFFSLQILKTQYKDISTKIRCQELLLIRMICQGQYAGGTLQIGLWDEEGGFSVAGLCLETVNELCMRTTERCHF